MASIRMLKNKLKSIASIRSFTGAVRTVSSANFGRLSVIKRDFEPYAVACAEALSDAGYVLSAPENACDRTLFVLFTANKSLCGEYNSAICRYFASLPQENDIVYVCGEWGRMHSEEKKISISGSFVRGDIPTAEQSAEMCARLLEEYKSGNVNRVVFVYQSFVNMLVQKPVQRVLLPLEASAPIGEDDIIFLPDKASVAESVLKKSLEAECRSVMIEASLGSQAATAMAMRNAYENACEIYDKLLIGINRMRQSIVTSDVIETSSRAKDEDL